MIDPLDYIDADEGRPEAFYAEALPCESCGEPTFRGRVWNQEHELWIAVDCSCNTPELPTCPVLIPELEQAVTVREVCRVIREHRKTCHLCRPVEISKEAPREPASVRKEAA
jgi:hypothetical protein